MDQKIFTMDLSVAAVSAYLALCGLSDAGRLLTSEVLSEVWGGTGEELESGLSELESRGVLLLSGVSNIEILDAAGWK